MKLVLKAIGVLFQTLPRRWALATGRGFGWVFGSVIRYRRREAMEAIRRSFPEKPDAEIRGIVNRMYANLGMNAVEVFRMPKLSEGELRDVLRWEGEERVRAALERGRGVVVLAAHIGNWEMLCTLTPRFGYGSATVAKEIKNRAVNAYLADIRKQFGLKVFPARHSARLCLMALKRNEMVGFILDQNMRRGQGIFVDFFGRPACTTPGLAHIAARSGAPVLPIFIVREGAGRHVVKVGSIMEPPADTEPGTIREHTQRCTRVIEDMIRAYPDQWIWLHRRWRTVPDPLADSIAAGDAARPEA